MSATLTPEKVTEEQQHGKRTSRWRGLGELFPILFGVIWLILTFYPILYMLMTSLRPLADFFTDIPWLPPTHPTLENYGNVLSNDFGLFFANTAFVTIISVFLIVVRITLCGVRDFKDPQSLYTGNLQACFYWGWQSRCKQRLCRSMP